MKKIWHKASAIFGAGALLLFLPLAGTSLAAGKTVLVLPFAVDSGAGTPDAAERIPQGIADKLKAQGLDPVPMDKAKGVFSASGRETINLEMARMLGRAAGADLVVYGLYSRKGEGFVMETRLVPTDGESAVPAHFERSSQDGFADAAGELARRADAVLRRAQEPPAPDGAAPPADREVQLVPMSVPAAGALADVQVRGLRHLDPDVVMMRLSIRRGDKPDAAAVNEEVKRIWEMGWFTDVQAGMEGDVLVFTVKEKPRIDAVEVEGAGKIDREDVLGAMTTRKGNVLNEQVLAGDMQKITELYRREGYYLAKPAYRLESRGGGRRTVLVVEVNEGRKLYVSEVKVDGLKELRQSDMEKYMALRRRGVFSWLTGSGVLKEEYLERDAAAIAAYALNEGFVDVQVGAPEVEYREDGIHVRFPVSEGERYKVGKVEYAGDVIDSEEGMDRIIEMPSRRGSWFPLSVMQDDAKKLQSWYNDHGYAYAEVDTRIVKPDDAPGTVNVVYAISKKQKVFIRRLVVEGNAKMRDNVILREMRLGDGDPYEGAKLRRSMERLNRLRYFSAVEAELVPTGREDEVDLKVKVKEGNTGALMAGVGYSTYYGAGVSGTVMERNLFGRGYGLSLQGFFSWRRVSGALSFVNPRIYDTDLSFSNELYYVRDYWDDFTKETLGDSFTFAYPVGEYTTVGLGYRLERYELYDVDANASPYIADYKGVNWTSAVHGRILRDTTDSRERPTKGTIARLWGEWGGGGLGGTDNFVKLVGDWQGFYSFNDVNTVHVRGRLGALFQNTAENIPVFERFYVGGMDTVRGYSYSDASPRSKDPRYDHDVIGGDFMGIGNLEYVYTFQKDMGLSIVPFFDIGFNVDSKSDRLKLDFDKNWVYSTGLELRWRSPMGDLRLAYGIPLKKDFDNEMEQGRLEFSMGQFF